MPAYTANLLAQTSHEPKTSVVDFQWFTQLWFMAGEQVSKEQGAFHEPECHLSSLGEVESHEKECSQPIAPWLYDHDGAPVSKPALRGRSRQIIPPVRGR